MTKINKVGWKRIKLGEIITEYSKKNRADEDIPVYSVTNSAGFCREYFSKEVASKDKSTYKIVPYGCFAYNPSRINVGSIGLQEEEERVIVSPLYNVFSTSESIESHYLLYYLKSDVALHLINAKATGTVRMNLRIDMLRDFDFDLPPLPIQLRIVEELDEINAVISEKKEQLRKLDELAQSIFYNMFGDPVTNEKGWAVKTLGETCTKITDGSHNPPQGVDISDYLMLSSKNVTYSGFTFEEPRYLTKEQFDSENKRTNVTKGDVFLVIVGAGVGKCCVYTYELPITLQRSVAVLRPNVNLLQSVYLNAFLQGAHDLICSNANGAAQKGIYLKQLSKINIPLPPLPLQSAFASRVAAIEEEKAAIAESIEKMQMLLNARMQEYFG